MQATLYLALKALISGVLIAAASTLAKRYPGFGPLLPSLPMFLVIPALLRQGMPSWPAFALGCALTVLLYLCMVALEPRLGIALSTGLSPSPPPSMRRHI